MHEISLTHYTDTGHRIVGHENGKGKCARLHGHTYRWEIAIASPSLLPVGFVMDFATIKKTLDNWDHRTLLWVDDPFYSMLNSIAPWTTVTRSDLDDWFVGVPFNPTAENMARYMAGVLLTRLQIAHAKGEEALAEGEGYAVQVELWETPKSSARFVAR